VEKYTKLNSKFKNLHDLERKILNYSGLSLDKDIKIIDVPLNDLEGNYIHTITCGDYSKPALLLIHGYANAGVFFYKMFKDLSKHFKVYCIDTLGNGSSSRSKFNSTDPKETIKFVTEKIELWRKYLKIEKL